jgi:hypothetical protein
MLPILLLLLQMSFPFITATLYHPAASFQFDLERVRGNVPSKEEDWLSSLQRADGAIVDSKSSGSKITPYFANMAATSLSRNPYYEPVVRNYAEWYFQHINKADKFGYSGTIYDYTVSSNNGLTSKEDYDSADSYAATFISLLRTYSESGNNTQWLRAHRTDIDLIGNVMLGMLDEDNLSWAKPNYKMKYLMDNCEVYRGLKDLSYLYEHLFSDKEQSIVIGLKAGLVKQAILDHFSNGNEFYTYIDGNHKGHSVNWEHWYPDASSQFYPLVFGILKKEDPRSIRLYQKLNEHHPNWHMLQKDDPFPWAIIGYAAALMGDRERADSYTKMVEAAYIEKGHTWPWYSLESAWYIRTRYEIRMNPKGLRPYLKALQTNFQSR